jgi:glycosyltransferase involved in cell wall biosynthesis
MILYNHRLILNGAWWERIVGAEEYLKFLRYEPALAETADLSIFCSTVDRDCVLSQNPDLRCAIVPNGVDCAHFFRKQESEAEPSTIILTGNFGYRPNRQAAIHFLKQIFPVIHRSLPEVRFIAVGSGATRELKRYVGDEHIQLIDFVPDLRPYLAKATVAVAPIRVGVGVSNKILQAFSVGTPVVSTAFACGDLPVRNGEHLYLANEPEVFADRVLKLMLDPSLRTRFADRGAALVRSTYDWETVSQQMEDLMLQLVHSSQKVPATPSVAQLV